MKKFLYIIVIILTTIGCTKTNPIQSNKVVIEAFLFLDEPIDDIRVTTLLAYGGEDTLPQPINDAEIDIIWQGNSYRLQSTNDSGYYHYPGNDLQVKEGEIYELKLNYNDFDISALTVCPPKPQNITSTKDTMKLIIVSLIDSFLTGGNITPPPPDSVIVSWPNANNEYYYVIAENIDSNAVNIYPDFIGGLLSFFFQSEPTTESSYTFFDSDFRKFGKHEIRVYKVNQEYVDLYTSFNQDSRTQAEPLTNIVNGLGVFTAVSYESIPLYVTRE